LRRESAEELLAALLEDAVELRPLKRLIIERMGGNRFFNEEMVQALFDEGVLARNGAVKVTRSPSQVQLPTTVRRTVNAADRLAQWRPSAACNRRLRPIGLKRGEKASAFSPSNHRLSRVRAS
jgi:predicted ATPase